MPSNQTKLDKHTEVEGTAITTERVTKAKGEYIEGFAQLNF